MPRRSHPDSWSMLRPIIAGLVLITCCLWYLPLSAQEETPEATETPAMVATPEAEMAQVQILTGNLAALANDKYRLTDMKQGQILSVYVANTSGNLDPSIALATGNLESAIVDNLREDAIATGVAEGRDPVAVLFELADELFLAANDDGGDGYDASFVYELPEDGDYSLFVGSGLRNQTFGDYQMIIGVNADDVHPDSAIETGDVLAEIDRSDSTSRASIQEVTGSFAADDTPLELELRDFDADETLQVFVEGTDGNLRPVIGLKDFSGKFVATANVGGEESVASFDYTFDSATEGFMLHIDPSQTSGDYRLLIGAGAPVVLTGRATELGPPIISEPTPVQIGIQIDQITGIDQQDENFSIVGTLRFDWYDPERAFSPDSCQCTQQSFVGDAFGNFVRADAALTWPDFLIFNQQGRRDTQNRAIVVQSDGSAIFGERFTVTLQAPDFNFRLFPFDTQQFFFHVDSIFQDSVYVYTDLEGYTGFGDQLGEEEWIVTDEETSITTVDGNSRFTFGFKAHRHLLFYITRIILPVLLIIIVSWITFFLKDYGKRVDVCSANLLVFVAFNFTISGELPRLGYLTLMDTLLVSTFVITSVTIALNVMLRRLEGAGKAQLAHKIDRWAIWLYPISYAVAFTVVLVSFR